MDKQSFSRILAYADRDAVISLAADIQSEHEVTLIRPPAKTMVMMLIKEPIRGTRFYLGELLAIECLVAVDGVNGVAVLMGDDSEKAVAMAVLDAAHTGEFAQMNHVYACMIDLAAIRKAAIEREAAIHRGTQVDFHALEDEHAAVSV